MTTQTPRINQVRIVGTLDTQTISRRDAASLPGVIPAAGRGERPRATVTRRFNAVQGSEQRAVLQVASPFGTPFQITLHLEASVAGCALLESSPPGTILAATGELEWVQITDPRYAVDIDDRGRRSSELIVRAHTVELAGDDDQPGYDVWLEGSVLTTPRILRHPDRPVLIAATTVRVTIEHTRPGSRARITEPANVAVAIPVDHPDAPNLLRPGNQVIIEGMLERYLVPLRGVEIERAVAALDAGWQQEQAGLSAQAQRDAARRYARQRRRLQETTRTRVVAGYVELVSGTPASLDEAQELRAESQRRRREDRRGRRERPTERNEAPEEQAPTNDSIDAADPSAV
ncbi:hypothetical protein EKD04_021570 [Chloroflexales bacterium ZM16-3]|nr:hypothetical protein [Chloroflexales bacterium ZM16-3]